MFYNMFRSGFLFGSIFLSHRLLSSFIDGFLCFLSLVTFFPIANDSPVYLKKNQNYSNTKKQAVGKAANISPA